MNTYEKSSNRDRLNEMINNLSFEDYNIENDHASKSKLPKRFFLDFNNTNKSEINNISPKEKTKKLKFTNKSNISENSDIGDSLVVQEVSFNYGVSLI